MNLDFLLEMGWKSALIAGVALFLAALMRRRAPADRAAVLQLALALLLMMPIVSLLLPALEIETPRTSIEARQPAFQVADPMVQAPEVSPTLLYDRLGAEDAAIEGGTMLDVNEMLLAGYALGFLLVLARLTAGLVTLRRWARRADPVLASEWTDALLRSAAPGRPLPRLLVSDEAPAPMSWGFNNPVILLDRHSAARSEDAEAIIVHEMAHISRRDWLSLLMARAAVAIFWFNPLVWLLERDMFQQAEEAADAAALGSVEPTRYAQTLVTCAGHRSNARVPANSMAASGLKRRVRAVLDGGGIKAGSRWTLAAMLGCIAFAAPVAALELVEAPLAPEAPIAPEAPDAPSAPSPVIAPDAPDAPAAPIAPVTLASVQDVAVRPTVTVTAPSDVHVQVHTAPAAPNAPAAPAAPPAPYARAVPHAFPSISVPDGAEISRRVQESLKGLDVQIATAVHASADGEEIARLTAAATRRGLAEGALGMEQGALRMEQGALKMENEAAKFRSRSYREQIIARERARGHDVTHEDLIDAGRDLHDGARDLRDGARDMREAARDMRRSG